MRLLEIQCVLLKARANHPHFVASQDGYQLMVMQV